MALTNRQIERYSRQIIVEKFGGVAQERLLASRLLLVGDYAEVEVALGYLVGAGIGRIDLQVNLDSAARDARDGIVARMRDLNADSIVAVESETGLQGAEIDLVLAIVSTRDALDRVRSLFDRTATFRADAGVVFARLDLPARIAVIPHRPPCLQCASVGELLGPLGERSGNPGFIAMLAALETIKLLARLDSTSKPMLHEFNGYSSSSRTIDSTRGSECGCETTKGRQRPDGAGSGGAGSDDAGSR